ncbi:hypothetical protein BJV82DRAFT_617808 [Fennellomyces sp. T-0311]|nr:hypothetical protein BJV82DRAFT_617808 [Fennellomyces sp. T-0311]
MWCSCVWYLASVCVSLIQYLGFFLSQIRIGPLHDSWLISWHTLLSRMFEILFYRVIVGLLFIQAGKACLDSSK